MKINLNICSIKINSEVGQDVGFSYEAWAVSTEQDDILLFAYSQPEARNIVPGNPFFTQSSLGCLASPSVIITVFWKIIGLREEASWRS